MVLRTFFASLLCLAAVARAETFRVGAAVSLKDALGEIAAQYQADTGHAAEFVFGSSGQIAAQIKSGAPIDAFISAATVQMADLARNGLIDAGTQRVVAGNTLVVVVSPISSFKPQSFSDLTKDGVVRLAVGEPKTVPAGQYAQQVFTSLKINDALQAKIVYGTNVRQVLAYVERGEVTAGVVYATDARQSGEKVSVAATADPATHEPIVYPAVVVARSDHAAAAKGFLDFLATEKAVAVLRAKGFTIPPPEQAASPAGSLATRPATP